MKPTIKIIFFGTSEFAVPALETLKNKGYDIVAVITNPDELAGRNRISTPPPVKIAAQKLRLKILQPEKLRNNSEIIETLKKLEPAVGIVAAYGKIIPAEIINLPKYGILNIHPSLLPKYRGASPIQYALLNGDETTGVTIIKIDEQMDHGPIIAAEKLEINDENYKELHDKLAKLGVELLIKILPDYLEGKIEPAPQDHNMATFTKLIKTHDGEIKTNDNSRAAYNKIRALNPEPGAFIVIQNKRLKILEVEMPEQKKTSIAEDLFNLDGRLGLQLKDGQLILKTVQLEGKKPMKGEDFIKGHANLLSGR